MRRALTLLLLLGSACPSGDSSCSETAALATGEVADRAGLHAAPCVRDDDCAEAPVKLSCYESCAVAVLKTQREDFIAELDTVDRKVCSGNGCTIKVGCLQSYAACKGGTCKMVEGVPDAGSSDGGTRDGGTGDGG